MWGITLTLAETGTNSDTFTSSAFGRNLGFTFGESDDVNKLIRVAHGQRVWAIYTDLLPALSRTNFAVFDARPVITAQPQSRTNEVGTEAMFSMTATGFTALSYQWLFGGVPIPHATNATLTLPNVQTAQAGSYAVSVATSAGAVTSVVVTLTVLACQVSGLVELEAFVGTTRTVTFKATDSGGVVRKTWNESLNFAGGSLAGYALSDVPLDTVSLSAKTDWNLRRKLGVSFTNNAAAANFTGSHLLPAGDLDNSNTVNLADYYALASVWYTSNPAADLDGSGFVDMDDYFLLSNHWNQSGDSE